MGQEQGHKGIREAEGKPINTAQILTGGGTSSRRIGYIDALKGFGILCVVIGHVAGTYMESNVYPYMNGFFRLIYYLIYSFHMPLFMVLSGYVYFSAYMDTDGRPQRKRIIYQVLNTLWVYIIFSLGYGMCQLIFSRYVNDPITTRDLLLIPFYPLKTYWYIYVLIELYLFFLIPKVAECKSLLLLCVTLLVNLLSVYMSGPCEINKFTYYLFFFTLGLLIAREGKQQSKLKLRGLPVLMACLSVMLIIIFWNDGRNINEIPVVNVVTATGLSLGLIQLFKHCKQLSDNRILRFFGRHSLEIYVMHGILVSGVRALLPRFISGACMNLVICFCIGTGIPLLVAGTCRKLNIYDLLFCPVDVIRERVETKNTYE